MIDDNEPVIINYCDFFMDWDYSDFKKVVAENDYDGAVVAYKGFHPHLLHEENFYASMRADANNNMIEIKEKHSFTANKMDSPQSGGTYYFKRYAYIKKYFQRLMDEKISLNGEYYVSLVYNLLKQDGLRVFVYDKVPHFCNGERRKIWKNINIGRRFLKNMDKTRKQIIRFVMVGIPVVAMDFLTYYMFVNFLPHYIARIIAYIFGSTTSYVLNKLYTFEQKQKSFNEMVRFYALYFFTLLFTVIANGFLLSVLFPGKIILAYSLSTFMGIILNFAGQKFFVFRLKNKYEI